MYEMPQIQLPFILLLLLFFIAAHPAVMMDGVWSIVGPLSVWWAATNVWLC